MPFSFMFFNLKRFILHCNDRQAILRPIASFRKFKEQITKRFKQEILNIKIVDEGVPLEYIQDDIDY